MASLGLYYRLATVRYNLNGEVSTRIDLSFVGGGDRQPANWWIPFHTMPSSQPDMVNTHEKYLLGNCVALGAFLNVRKYVTRFSTQIFFLSLRQIRKFRIWFRFRRDVIFGTLWILTPRGVYTPQCKNPQCLWQRGVKWTFFFFKKLCYVHDTAKSNCTP